MKPDSVILVRNARGGSIGYIPAFNVEVGDLVWSRAGCWTAVREVRRETAPAVRVNGYGRPPIVLAADQPIAATRAGAEVAIMRADELARADVPVQPKPEHFRHYVDRHPIHPTDELSARLLGAFVLRGWRCYDGSEVSIVGGEALRRDVRLAGLRTRPGVAPMTVIITDERFVGWCARFVGGAQVARLAFGPHAGAVLSGALDGGNQWEVVNDRGRAMSMLLLSQTQPSRTSLIVTDAQAGYYRLRWTSCAEDRAVASVDDVGECELVRIRADGGMLVDGLFVG